MRKYLEKDVEVNGHTHPRPRIDVIMDFTSVKGCEEICRTLRPGFIVHKSGRTSTVRVQQRCVTFLSSNMRRLQGSGGVGVGIECHQCLQ
jgi:hypothetical protein